MNIFMFSHACILSHHPYHQIIYVMYDMMHDEIINIMGWLRSVGSFKLTVHFAKETYNRDDILQKRPKI